MKPKYSKRTVDEAVQLLDVYASQMFWAPNTHYSLDDVAAAMSSRAWLLAFEAWVDVPGELLESAAEAAQRLREGWRP
jgi:hypothetical protein